MVGGGIPGDEGRLIEGNTYVPLSITLGRLKRCMAPGGLVPLP